MARPNQWRNSLQTFALCLFCTFLDPAFAAVWSDTWWNRNESGWGVNIADQGSVMFATFYVYGVDGSARWYTSALRRGALLPNLYYRYDGDLYQTSGPFLGGPFNPANVSSRRVGTASFLPTSAYSANLLYSVDGVAVTKSIERFTFNHIDLNGYYAGTYVVRQSTCFDVAVGAIGTMDLVLDPRVNADGLSGTLQTQVSIDGAAYCFLSGTYRQYGSVFAMLNASACTTLSARLISFVDFSSTDDGIEANVSLTAPACQVRATMSAVRVRRLL